MHHLNQIMLMCHDLVDVFISHRNLIHDTTIFTTFNTACLGFDIITVELLFCGGAAHDAACAVRARTKRLRVAFAAHDVRLRAHAAGDDA